MLRNRSIGLILYKIFGFIVVSLFLLWPFFEGNYAWGVDYCIHPSGSQAWPNCVAGAGPTCAGAGSSCTLTAANANLTAGNRALLMGGDYLAEKIDPVNDGDAHTNRVTFKAYGDADVILPNITGGNQSTSMGAINIDNREWMLIDGQGVIGDQARQRFRIDTINTSWVSTRPISVAIGMSATQNSILRYVWAKSCDFAQTAAFCSNRRFERGLTMCGNHLVGYCGQYGRDSQFNVVENVYIQGNFRAGVTSSNDPDITNDLLVIESTSSHILLDGIELRETGHTAFKPTGTNTHHIVARGMVCDNEWKSCSSYLGAGRNLYTTQSLAFLMEDSSMATTQDNAGLPQGFSGGACKFSASDLIARHVVCTRANSETVHEPVQTLDVFARNKSGGGPPVTMASRNRFYNITMANSRGKILVSVTDEDTPILTEQYGNNRWANNFVYDTYWTQTQFGRLIDYNYPNTFGASQRDFWRRNVVGRPGVGAGTNFIKIPGRGQIDLATAKTLTSPDPAWADWSVGGQTFANEWMNDGTTQFVDYANRDFNLAPGSNWIDAGAPLTTVTVILGANQVRLEDSRWFYAEAVNFPSWMGVEMDWVCIGPDASNINAAGTDCVQLTAVDDASGNVTFTPSASVSVGDVVWLYRNSSGRVVVNGNAPDIGALESGTAPTNTPPAIAEVTPIATPTTQLTNTYVFNLADPDDAGPFNLSWGNGCTGPATVPAVGNHSVSVTVTSPGTYNCTLQATDGQANSNTLLMTQFVVQGAAVQLDMDRSAWTRYVAPESGSITNDQACPAVNGTSIFGTSLEIGPYRAGQFDTCRVQYNTRVAATQIIVRGQYRTTNLSSWGSSIDVCYFTSGVRGFCKEYRLPETAGNWQPFEKIFYNPEPGSDEIQIRANVKHKGTNNRLDIAAVEYDLTIPVETYPVDYGTLTKAVPASRTPTGRFEFVETSTDVWHLFDDQGTPVAPMVGYPRVFSSGETAIMQDTYDKLIAQNWAIVEGSRAPREMAEYAEGQGTREIPFYTRPSAQSGGVFAFAEKYDGATTAVNGHEFPDPWDPAFRTAVRTAVQTQYDNARGVESAPKPKWFVAMAVDNEIHLGNNDLYRYVYSTFANAQFILYLQGLYPTIAALNTAWGTSFADYDAIFTANTDPELMDPTDQIFLDWRGFEPIMLTQYFDVIESEIKAIATTENICSPSLYRASIITYIRYASVWRNRYDCILFNAYPRWYSGSGLPPEDQQSVDELYAATGKPIIINEYSVPAVDSGLYDGPTLDFSFGQVVDTQENRSRRASQQAMGNYNHPAIVGARWFRWNDYNNPPDSRDANRGLYEGDDVTPYTTLIDRFTTQNAAILPLFAPSACPKSGTDGSITFNASICTLTAEAGELHIGKAQGGPFEDACGVWAIGACNTNPDCPTNAPIRCDVTVDGLGTGIDYWFQWQSPAGTVLQEDAAARQVP